MGSLQEQRVLRPEIDCGRGRPATFFGVMNPPGQVSIRSASLDDFDAWFRLYDAVAAEGKWIGGEAPSDRSARRQSYESHQLNPDAITFLAVSGERLVGALGVSVNGGIAELGMMVDAGFRGRGIGSALLGACIDWAGEQRAHKVILEVWPHNVAARQLYEKHGFVIEGRFQRHYRRRNGELWDAIRMGLVLDQESAGSPFADS